MSLRLRVGAIGLLGIALAIGLAGSASAGSEQHATTDSSEHVRDYWTAGRMRSAEAVEPPIAPEEATASNRRPSLYSQAPDQEIDPALDVLFPYRIHGRLFISTPQGDASCSATVVRSFTANLLLTAGHCVATPPFQFHTNVLFVPAYRNGAAPFGVYPATKLGAPTLWLQEGDISFDIGTVNVVPGPSGEIQEVLGARGVTFNQRSKKYNGKTFEIFGYPAQPEAFYDGERPILCISPFQGFEDFTGSPVAGPCHQQQGSSGGGWVRNGLVSSVVSHGGCIIPSTACEITSGTYFGDEAYKLWDKGAGSVPKGRRKRIKKCKAIDKNSKRLNCLNRAETYQPVPR
jgi:hypothetical protein